MNGRHFRKLVLATAAGATVALASHGALAGSASPTIPTPHPMLSISALGVRDGAAAATGPEMTYQTAGAPVETAPVVYVIFWGEQWSVGWKDVTTSGQTYSSNQAKTYITDFFKFLGNSATKWFGSQTQYCSGVPVGTINCGTSGKHITNPPKFGGAWVDTSSPPPPPVVPDNCLYVCVYGDPTLNAANLLGQEAIRAEQHFGGYKAGADYMIMLPKATATPGYGLYCAYHSQIADGKGHQISFSNMPYVLDMSSNCGANFVNAKNNAFGNGYMDGYSIVAGHEFAEAATDPLPFTPSAWRDSSGQETGDKCAWISPGTPGGAHNVGPDAAGHYYAVQTLWSNLASGCV